MQVLSRDQFIILAKQQFEVVSSVRDLIKEENAIEPFEEDYNCSICF
jgi:hypothetical protein